MRLEARFRFDRQDGSIALAFLAGDDERTVPSFDRASGTVTLDRTASGDAGFDRRFADAFSGPVDLGDDVLDLRLLVDRSTAEVFVEGGATVISALVFPSPESRGLELSASGGPVRVLNLDVHEMGAFR